MLTVDTVEDSAISLADTIVANSKDKKGRSSQAHIIFWRHSCRNFVDVDQEVTKPGEKILVRFVGTFTEKLISPNLLLSFVQKFLSKV